MSKSPRILAVAGTFSALCFAASTVFAGELSEPKDLKDSQCKDIMILSGQDREIAIAFAHGYILGKKNTTRYVPEELGKATDDFMDYCLDHPKENALAAFEKFTK
jgi:hypothetical protein